ncbi:MAG TPA: ferritin [Bacteroidales bacterium]|nr:ferritin [Bacteroidales bacterium]
MLTQKVEAILVEQIEKEGYSSNLYLAMASWAEAEGLEGISQWLYAQAEEEHMHMLKLVHYVNERGGKGIIPAFKQPPVSFPSVLDLFKEVLKHEQFVSASINEIVAVCIAEKDFTTQNWVQWYVNEQIEEEKNAQAILDKLKLIGDGSLYMFDRDIIGMRGAAGTGTAE